VIIRSELEYEALEAQERQVQTGKGASGDCYAELKQELQEVKQTLHTVVAQFSKLKARPAELKPGLNPELDARKLEIAPNYLAPVFVVFVSVLIGVSLAGRWK
jgi:NADH:ubiquinone oxidoreductase subunit D